MQKSIEQILNMDLSQEEKEALLGALANELIENKSKDWENKNEELKEKSRTKAQEVRERQEKRDKEYALNYEIKKMEDALLKITNNRGEHVCTKESLNELSLGELEELYYRYFGEHKLDGVYEKYYGFDNREHDEDKNKEVNKKHAVKRTDKELIDSHRSEKKDSEEDFNLDEFIDMMTTEEMNTILQMKASGKYDDTILNNISTRLDIPISKLEEIATKKEAKLKEQEKDKEVEKDNSTNENSAGSSGSTSDDNQEKSEDKKTPKVDTQLEKPKKVKGIGKITGKLKTKINAKAVVAVAAVAAGIAILAANPLAMGYAALAGAGKIYMDYSKGKK